MLSPGDKVSYFQVVEPIAAGGMALVWRGHDSLLDRGVAIKQIAAGDAADEAAREAFRKEAEIQKQVSASHKNLVNVLEFVEDERGLFLVMEYVEGSSLDQTLDRLGGPMPPKQALGIIHQVAVGLAAIHSAGVIHRDLKPSNILLPEEGGVKICDFGIATSADDQDLHNLGTARYMAPEMFTEEEIDARADLYGLGMISYEMLAGRPAFEDAFKTVLRDKRNQSLRWMKWHTNQRVQAPSLAKLNPELPQPLVELVERLMAKDPDARIPSAQQLIEVLKRNFSGQRPQQAGGGAGGVSQTPAASAEPTAPLPKRSKVTIILAIVLGLQALAIGGWFGYEQWQASEGREDERAAALRAYGEAREAYETGQREDLIAAGKAFHELSETWPNDPVLGTAAEARFELISGRYKARQATELTENLEFEAALAKYDAAIDHFDRARDLALNLDLDGVGALIEEIDDREQQARESQALPERGAAVVDKIESADFLGARRLIREFRDRFSASLLAYEKRILHELGQRIEARAALATLDEMLAEAEALREQGRYEQALEVMRQAQDEELNDHRVRELRRELEREIKYERAMADARKAEDAGNLGEAIKQYRRANRVEPDEQIESKLTDLRSELAYRQGRDAERAGNLDRARQKYIESKTIKPNRQAEQGLARIGKAEDYQSLVQLGNQKFSGGSYTTAIDAWQKALDLATEEGEKQVLRSKIREARVQHHLQLARQAMEREAYGQASRQVDQALQADANDAVARGLRQDLDLIQNYNALLEQGDQAREDSRFSAAKRRYREAKELIAETSIPTDEVDQRLEDAEYESWIAQGRSYMQAHRWEQARASLQTAQRIRDTDTVRDLLDEVASHLQG